MLIHGKLDSRIYIWRSNGLLVEALDAHVGCVNAVAWHPTDPRIFASAGDDAKVKIWKPNSAAAAAAAASSNENGHGRWN
jgi:WD40 repeat protein